MGEGLLDGGFLACHLELQSHEGQFELCFTLLCCSLLFVTPKRKWMNTFEFPKNCVNGLSLADIYFNRG